DGYVLKTDSRAELFNAVHRIASGKSYISPSALDRMVTAYAKTSDRLPGRTRGSGALTSREQEVITLIAKGYRTREMAELMSLSHKTVEKHRTNLMRKLGLRAAAAVAAYAITHGFACQSRYRLPQRGQSTGNSACSIGASAGRVSVSPGKSGEVFQRRGAWRMSSAMSRTAE